MHFRTWSTFDLAFGATGFCIGMIGAYINEPAVSWLGGGFFGMAIMWYHYDKHDGR